MEAEIRDPARAPSGNQFQFGVVNQQSGWRIGSRRSIGNISSQRAAILIGDTTGLGRGAADKRKFLSQDTMPLQLGVGG
jgi:hypothetical protein